MKKILHLVLILVLCQFIFGKQVSNKDLGLVGLWHLNEGFNTYTRDEISNKYGVITGASWVTGKYSKCLYFDGIDDKVTLDSINDLPSGNSKRTITVWFNTPEFTSNWQQRPLFSYGATSNYSMFTISLWSTDTAELRRIRLDCYNAGCNWEIQFPLNSWNFLVITYDGTNATMYLNVTSSYTANPGTVNTNLTGGLKYIGYSSWLGSYYYHKGYIDEIAVYNRVLSIGEIKNLYREGRAKLIN